MIIQLLLFKMKNFKMLYIFEQLSLPHIYKDLGLCSIPKNKREQNKNQKSKREHKILGKNIPTLRNKQIIIGEMDSFI